MRNLVWGRGILDAKRGFAGRNFYDWLFSGILLCIRFEIARWNLVAVWCSNAKARILLWKSWNLVWGRGILDAKRGFAGRNFYDWLFSGILLRAFCVSEVESYQRFYAIILSVLVAL